MLLSTSHLSQEIKSIRFKTFFVSIVIVFIYYNFPYIFLGKKIGFPLDDAWIHMTYARNIFSDGIFSFNGIHPSTGDSSLLWPLILSLFFNLPAYLVVASIHLFNMFVLFLLVCVWYQVMRNIFMDERLAFLIAFLVTLCGNLVWISLLGLESIFFLFLGIGSVYFFGKKKYAFAGILSAILILTRPEGLALPLAFATIEIYSLLKKADINYRKLLFLFIPPLAAFLLYLGFNLSITGQFLTSSFRGRRWLYGFPQYVPFPGGPYYGGKLLMERWFRHIIDYSLGLRIIDPLFQKSIRFPLKILGMTFFLSGITFYLISFFSNIRQKASSPESNNSSRWSFLKKNREWYGMEIPLILWTLYHNVAYAIFLPDPGHGNRYQQINLLWVIIFFVVGFRGCGELLSMVLSSYEKKIKTLLLFSFAAVTIVQFLYWGFVYQRCINHINSVHVKAAEWVKENIPSREKIAAFDIGAMGFFSDREIVDMGGLIDPEATSYLFRGSIVPYLRKKQIKYMAVVKRFTDKSGLIYRLGICQADGGDFNLIPLYNVGLERGFFENFHRPAAGSTYPEIYIYKVEWQENQ